jgi:FAD/FMN-containing dehydrogenase
VRRVRTDGTAFGRLDAPFAFNLIATWPEATDSERHFAWAREFSSTLLPYSTRGVYVNFLGEEGETRVRAAYGENYERLVAIKTKYDPTNLFRQNQNIVPSDKWETKR